jgi:DNA modification methylase
MSDLPINQIICGDCLEVMKDWPDGCIELVLTDPPYGIGTGKQPVGRNGLVWGEQEWDQQPIDQKSLDVARKKGVYQIVWGGNYYALPPSRCWLVWDKKQPMEWYSTAHFELAWTNMDKNGHAFRKSQVEAHSNMDKRHPSQKPLDLIVWCIQEVPKADLILDPFCGSGPTCVAAKKLGRGYIGIDISPEYCEIARKRLAAVDTGVPVPEADRGQIALPFK